MTNEEQVDKDILELIWCVENQDERIETVIGTLIKIYGKSGRLDLVKVIQTRTGRPWGIEKTDRPWGTEKK